MGWVKHTPPASADGRLRSGSNLTAFHHVKLGCSDWIRSDLLRPISAVTHHFVFFEMVTKGPIVRFFQLDNSVACLPLWVGVSLAPFQSRGYSLFRHNSFRTIESSFKAASANSFTILGQISPDARQSEHIWFNQLLFNLSFPYSNLSCCSSPSLPPPPPAPQLVLIVSVSWTSNLF